MVVPIGDSLSRPTAARSQVWHAKKYGTRGILSGYGECHRSEKQEPALQLPVPVLPNGQRKQEECDTPDQIAHDLDRCCRARHVASSIPIGSADV